MNQIAATPVRTKGRPERPGKVRIIIDVDVTDLAALITYVKERYRQCWQEEWEPETLVDAVLEALVLSARGPSPAEYGVHIIDRDGILLEPQV